MKVDLKFMKSVFKKSLDIHNYKLNKDSEFEKVPHWDSLGHMKIIAEIESRLNVEFDIDEIVGKDTVEKLINMINKKSKK